MEALPEVKQINPFVIPGIKKVDIDPNLNPSFSFNNFIEGECNRLARSAGLAVSANPGGTCFNPLFIYGESGLGKTHLAQAIGSKSKELFPDKNILYIDSIKFHDRLMHSYSEREFANFFQMIDVLILDDIQELAGKYKTQEFLFHIFNDLYPSKQIIFTSDKAPRDLYGFEKHLCSRLNWGLSAEIEIPSYETRIKILKHKAAFLPFTISQVMTECIAGYCLSNIREMEGVLNSLFAYYECYRCEITTELIEKIVNKFIVAKKEITIDYIQKVVSSYFNVPIEMLQSNTRKREIVQARQIAMYFSKSLTKSSLATIGLEIGDKDHATVLHACKTVNNLIETEKRFRFQIDEIERKLKS